MHSLWQTSFQRNILSLDLIHYACELGATLDFIHSLQKDHGPLYGLCSPSICVGLLPQSIDMQSGTFLHGEENTDLTPE
ncbi:hypothetical protein AOLI_G00005690 [Acnodon oligacanthus]